MASKGHHHSSHENATYLYGHNVHPHNFVSRNLTNHQRIHYGHLMQNEALVAHRKGLLPAEAGKREVILPAKVSVLTYDGAKVQRRMRDFHDRVVSGHSTKYRDPKAAFDSGSKPYIKYTD